MHSSVLSASLQCDEHCARGNYTIILKSQWKRGNLKIIFIGLYERKEQPKFTVPKLSELNEIIIILHLLVQFNSGPYFWVF